MKKFFSVLLLILLLSCTKEVPESEKNISKSVEETQVREVVDKFYQAYNSNDIETAISFFDNDYKGIAEDSNDVVGIAMLEDELYNFRKQYPEGEWKIEIEEVSVQNNLGYVITKGSFYVPDPVEGGISPQYSERCIRILKNIKNEGWKIFRAFSVPMYSYD